jgi:hypothetical protein
MPNDRSFPSRTASTAQIGPRAIRQAVLGGWLVSVAIVAAWMLAVLFPAGQSVHFEAPRPEIALVTSSLGAPSAKGDRLISKKAQERREGEVGTQSTPVPTGVRKIPVGCDAAFSRLVKFGNFTARCVT